MSFHNQLRDILVDKGKNAFDAKGNPYFKRSYSGDSEPIDIRRGFSSTEWNPDVIWVRKSKKFIIEIALSENWRSIVGEFTLAKLLDAWGILFITDFDEDYFSDLLKILENGLNYNKYSFYLLDEEELEDVNATSNQIIKWLRKWKFTGWKK